MAALRLARLQDKPVQLPVAQERLRDALRARRKTATALAAELGISRKQLSNVLSGRAAPGLRLLLVLGAASGVDPELVISLLDHGPVPQGCMKGTIEVPCDPTEPLEDWEMLES